jgi:phage FluMu protein gp41
MLQTEFPFRLPLGYVDAAGDLQRDGVMRLATAFDEIAPLKDPRVQANPGYLLVVLLSRVITRLGTLSPINPKTIEGLFAGDLAFLQAMYQRVNASSANQVRAHCPHCDQAFDVELSGAESSLGESGATP